MSSSIMEVTFPDSISDYYFYDEDGSPILFSILPLEWDGGDDTKVFLSGNIDGVESCFQVRAWNFDGHPELSVLLAAGNRRHWLKLLQPIQSYEELNKSVMVSLNCLLFIRREPNASWQEMVNHVSTLCSLSKPVDVYLLENIKFISDVTNRDETLKKSKAWNQILKTNLQNQRPRKHIQAQAGHQNEDMREIREMLTQLLYLKQQQRDEDILYWQALYKQNEQQHNEIKELFRKDKSFRTHFHETRNLAVNQSMSICISLAALLVSLLVSRSKLHAENHTFWTACGMFGFSVIVLYTLLMIYYCAIRDPAKIMKGPAFVAAPVSLLRGVFTEKGHARDTFRNVVIGLCAAACYVYIFAL